MKNQYKGGKTGESKKEAWTVCSFFVFLFFFFGKYMLNVTI